MIDYTESYNDYKSEFGSEPQIYTISVKGTIVFNSNGEGEFGYSSSGEIDTELSNNFSWTNIGRNEEDFNQTAQKYSVIYEDGFDEELIIDFSYSFKELTVRSNSGDSDSCYYEGLLAVCPMKSKRKMIKQ